MLRFYGFYQPPSDFRNLRLGGRCPHCGEGGRFSRTTDPIIEKLVDDKIQSIVLSYACELCLGPIPVQWEIPEYMFEPSGEPIVRVQHPKVILPVREDFEFQHVPESVRKEIEEALDCLSVQAYNGFAAVCRRVIQAVCTDLGAVATTKVKKQIEDMAQITGLDDELKDLAIQIMLSGHDGAHPHLPKVNAQRATVLLALLRDLIYELYTRPGKIEEATALRQKAIEDQKEDT